MIHRLTKCYCTYTMCLLLTVFIFPLLLISNMTLSTMEYLPVTVLQQNDKLNMSIETIAAVSARVQPAAVRTDNVTQNSRPHPKIDTDHSNSSKRMRFEPHLKGGSPRVYSILDIASHNEFIYDTYQPKEPYFISEEDRDTFYRVQINQDLMNPVPGNKLLGVVQVIDNGTFHLPYDCGWASSNESLLNRSIHYEVSTDILCPLIIPDGWAFQGFMDGTLPKIMQVYELLLHPSMKILLEEPRDKIIHEMLKKLGIRKEQLIFIKRSSTVVYHAKHMLFTCITPPLHPDLWKRARRALGVSERLQVEPKDAKIILLTRKFTSNGGRTMANLKETLTMLRNRYGKDHVVVFERYHNLTSSIQFFQQARLIIGIHGGAFYNLNFAPRDTTLIEILPSDNDGEPVPRFLAHTIFWTMSTLLNQTFWRIYHRLGSHRSHIHVNLDVLQFVLDKVDHKWMAMQNRNTRRRVQSSGS